MGVNFSVFEIGRRALRAAQTGVEVASHNIANVNTPGYSRQSVQLSASKPDEGYGWLLGTGINIGTGVNVDGIKSSRDQFIATRLQTETATNGRLTAERDALAPVEATFNEADKGGIGSALKNFFGAFRELEANPTSTAIRTSIVEKGNALASAFHATRARLTEIRAQADQDVRTTVNTINDLTEKVAGLNKQIRSAENNGVNISDLTDQRTVFINQIAELTGARSTTNVDGTITLTLGDGQALVYGDQVSTLTAADTPPAGLATLSIDGQPAVISDGKLRGWQNAISGIGGQIQTLDDLAASLAGRVNTLHASGTDLNGNAGGAFFATPASGPVTAENIDVAAALKTNPRRVVAAATGTGGGDGSVARSMAELLSDTTSVVGATTDSYSNVFASLVSSAGAAVKAADDELVTQAAILAQTQAQRDAVSGVSLDEEAISLLQYQKAYEAAARFLRVADEMTQTILQLGQ
ncbi:MAG TPA: flagellar hook-associated protein FlgK [Blastocatellia bacterium]|nr:flagellar hook-associated protein FlgK [Blastocatellia bacterium]